MDYIKLENIRFRARHGCLPQERKTGTDFVVTIIMGGRFEKEAREDKLFDDSLNYAEAYRLVEREMHKPSRIIENVAYRILNTLWNSFPALEYIRVELSKRHPPLTGQIEAATVIMEKRRTNESFGDKGK